MRISTLSYTLVFQRGAFNIRGALHITCFSFRFPSALLSFHGHYIATTPSTNSARVLLLLLSNRPSFAVAHTDWLSVNILVPSLLSTFWRFQPGWDFPFVFMTNWFRLFYLTTTFCLPQPFPLHFSDIPFGNTDRPLPIVLLIILTFEFLTFLNCLIPLYFYCWRAIAWSVVVTKAADNVSVGFPHAIFGILHSFRYPHMQNRSEKCGLSYQSTHALHTHYFQYISKSRCSSKDSLKTKRICLFIFHVAILKELT